MGGTGGDGRDDRRHDKRSLGLRVTLGQGTAVYESVRRAGGTRMTGGGSLHLRHGMVWRGREGGERGQRERGARTPGLGGRLHRDGRERTAGRHVPSPSTLLFHAQTSSPMSRSCGKRPSSLHCAAPCTSPGQWPIGQSRAFCAVHCTCRSVEQ